MHLPARLPVKHDGTAGLTEAKEWEGVKAAANHQRGL